MKDPSRSNTNGVKTSRKVFSNIYFCYSIHLQKMLFIPCPCLYSMTSYLPVVLHLKKYYRIHFFYQVHVDITSIVIFLPLSAC